MSNSAQPHGPQHARNPCPSPTPRVYSNSSPLSQWCHPTISSSVIPFSSCLQPFPAWGSFPMSQLFASGGQSIGVSASTSVLPINTQDWYPFLKKLEIELPYNPAIPLLGIHTEETRIERDMCTPMFIAALFTIARTWKQSRCSLADEWIRTLWYIYTMEYYSAIKNNASESVQMRWMKLEPIIQNEVSQKEKHQYSTLTHIYGI